MKSLLHLNKYFLKYRWRLSLGVLFVAISNVFAIYPAQVIRQAFDVVKETLVIHDLFNGFESQTVFYEKLATILLLFGGLVLLLAVIKGFFMYLMRQTIIVVSRHIEYDLKNEIFCQYENLSLAFYKRNKTGDLMNRISEDVSRVRMYLGPAIMYTINLIVLFVMVIVTMLNVNVKLTLFALLPLPLLSITIYKVSSLIHRKSERVQRQLSALSSFAQEMFSGIRVVKAYNRLDVKTDDFAEESLQYRDRSLALVRVNALFMPFMILLIGLSTILTIYIGGQLAMAGEVTTGNIAEFVIYVNMLTWPVASLGWVTSLVQRAAASQERINEFLQQEPDIVSPTDTPEEIRGDIEFKDVRFVYPDSGIEALQGISFSVKQGESLAILGRTGSGKSTVANLICRMYDPTEGSVLVDGKDLREHHLSSLRVSVGYVPQEVFLFSEDIANNIAFGKSVDSNDREAIEQAARDAAIYSNIQEFPEKFDTKVGERGITLSGGQKQRISIARAIIKSPRILIFDDCLSAVDTETEEEIIQNLKRIMQNKTTIIISHRVSSVKHCDKIIVLDDGQVAEFGNHAGLIDQKGIYFDLYQKQLLEEEQVKPA